VKYYVNYLKIKPDDGIQLHNICTTKRFVRLPILGEVLQFFQLKHSSEIDYGAKIYMADYFGQRPQVSRQI
jgi:hypothetical protein